jgi:hypothetical protein
MGTFSLIGIDSKRLLYLHAILIKWIELLAYLYAYSCMTMYSQIHEVGVF